ncbi:GTP-binding protein [Synechococcus elongatus IITB4]|uniref:CobW family GTP-binding protein n=1 Tax=Synechococcus elongatus TaxID=32046 RepID=UPI0030D35209
MKLQSKVRPQEKIPILILTGFLGSGKTTLLNYLLKNYQDQKIAVLMNELGDLDIDSQLLVQVDQNLIQLSNGCICCSINGSLVSSIQELIEREETINLLVIEASGVADPLPIILTILGTNLRDRCQLETILTLIDAENFLNALEESEVAQKQIVYGDLLMINKTDLVEEEQVLMIESKIRQLKREPRILKCQNSVISLSLLFNPHLAGDRFESLMEELQINHHEHHSHSELNDGFQAVTYERTAPFRIRDFQLWIDQQMPRQVYRAKGWLWLKESYQRYLFQLSGTRITMEDDTWPGEQKTQLVFIGRNLDPNIIHQQLDQILIREPLNL